MDNNTALQQRRERLDRLEHWLEGLVHLPIVGKVGLDSLVGLIPGVGDVFAAALGAWLIREGYQTNIPKPVLWKMIRNWAFDLLTGAVPGIGDAFDFFFRSNRKNAALLKAHWEQQLGVVKLRGEYVG
jgi:hypothetical protein